MKTVPTIVVHGGAGRVALGIAPDVAADELCAKVATMTLGGARATCGIILITRDGEVGLAHHSPHMSWAVARGDNDVEAGLRRPGPLLRP